MSERREEQRDQNQKLWDKTFTDNEDVDKEGHLSRTARRKQSSHNAQITTILVVIILILAATPVIYWVNHQRSFNHPPRMAKVASGSTRSAKKKVARPKHRSSQRRPDHSSKDSVNGATGSVATATSVTGATSSSQVATSPANGTSSGATGAAGTSSYATVGSGQGIYRVATNNGLTVDELARLNGITPATPLHPGQRLRVK